MKKAILGLAALVGMGCATAAHEMPVYTTVVRHPGNSRPAVVQPVSQPSEARVDPVLADVGRTVMSTRMCRNSEPVVTMDEHSYTLQCGDYTFIHYQHPEHRDVYGNVVLEAACEDILTQETIHRMEPDVTYARRWIDRDCNNVVDNYAAWQQRAGMEPRSETLPEEPASDANTEAYRNLTERLNIPAIHARWEELYSGM